MAARRTVLTSEGIYTGMDPLISRECLPSKAREALLLVVNCIAKHYCCSLKGLC